MAKFNLMRWMTKMGFAMQMPTPERKQQLETEGIGLSKDIIDYYDDMSKWLPMAERKRLGLVTEGLRYVVLSKKPLPWQGKFVFPLKVDKKEDVMIAYDPSASADVVVDQPPAGSKKKPSSRPGNYVRIPLASSEAKEYLKEYEAEQAEEKKVLLGKLKQFNALADKVQAGDLGGANITQIPLMIISEVEKLIPDRRAELDQQAKFFELEGEKPLPKGAVETEDEYRKNLSTGGFTNLEDEQQHILKLYVGKEEQLKADMGSGAVKASDAFKARWNAQVTYEDPNTGVQKTATELDRLIDARKALRDAESSKKVRDEMPTLVKFIEEIPETSALRSRETFKGPISSMQSQNKAKLISVRENLFKLNKLDRDLRTALEEINKLGARSDAYLSENPDEFNRILGILKDDATDFVKANAASIQKKPKDDNPSAAELDSRFLGKGIANLGISVYLYNLLKVLEAIEQRVGAKVAPIAPVASSGLKNAIAREAVGETRLTFDQWMEAYRPIQNPNGDDGVSGTFFSPQKKQNMEFLDKHPKANVWTLVEDEGGEYILAGMHYVAAVGYFVTENPNRGVESVKVEPGDYEKDEPSLPPPGDVSLEG